MGLSTLILTLAAFSLCWGTPQAQLLSQELPDGNVGNGPSPMAAGAEIFEPTVSLPGRGLSSVPSGHPGMEDTACLDGTSVCNDPHMVGLRGQQINWSGVDAHWYCLLVDNEVSFQVNARLTAPLPVQFPHRQLMTGLSILSEGHSLVVEVKDPYSIVTGGCPVDIVPCLADGGVRVVVDGQEMDFLVAPSRDVKVVDGIEMSSSNLPVECRQFGGDKVWARMYEEFLQGGRQLRAAESFEDWLLKYNNQAAPEWCRKYVAERGLSVQSNNAVFKIETPTVVVRLYAGVNHQGDGEVDWEGRTLPDLDFWQMDVGFEGLSLMHESLSGLLGETTRPVVDDEGHAIMNGLGALRGMVEDYRVSGALGTDFLLLHKASA